MKPYFLGMAFAVFSLMLSGCGGSDTHQEESAQTQEARIRQKPARPDRENALAASSASAMGAFSSRTQVPFEGVSN